MNAIIDLRAKADRMILQDLFEVLHAEAFFENWSTELISMSKLLETSENQELLRHIGTAGQVTPSQLWHWKVSHELSVYAAVEKSIFYPFQLQKNSRLVSKNNEGLSSLNCLTFLELLGIKITELDPNTADGIEVFRDMIETSIEQMTLSLSHKVAPEDLLSKDTGAFFQIMEEWASLRDRPFHPIAKAKMGLSHSEYANYMAEFDKKITLVWIAVKSDALKLGQGVVKPIADILLPDQQKATLDAEMAVKNLSQTHTALPVHPWQFEHYIKQHYATALEDGTCQILDFQSYEVKATSSLRSMAPLSEQCNYLKLPMHIFSLAASRYLPAVKMINGNLSEKLLRQGLRLDEKLDKHVYVCDETSWWAYFPEGTSLFDEVPRHLSAMIRTYPDILQDEQYRLIPMAALGTPLPGQNAHFFNDWMDYRKQEHTENNVVSLFREVCDTFFEINFRMFKIGMLGEIHGQNTVMVWKDGHIDGLLLRDHDSLRIFVPWLERSGLSDPEYQIKKGYANTLYHDRAKDLLFYLQTLGIQVNMRAILETVSDLFEIAPTKLWKEMRTSIVSALDLAEFTDEDRTMIDQQLFKKSSWPFKQLVKPIIARAGGPGSMPWGLGKVQNPFHQLDIY